MEIIEHILTELNNLDIGYQQISAGYRLFANDNAYFVDLESDIEKALNHLNTNKGVIDYLVKLYSSKVLGKELHKKEISPFEKFYNKNFI